MQFLILFLVFFLCFLVFPLLICSMILFLFMLSNYSLSRQCAMDGVPEYLNSLRVMYHYSFSFRGKAFILILTSLIWK